MHLFQCVHKVYILVLSLVKADLDVCEDPLPEVDIQKSPIDAHLDVRVA